MHETRASRGRPVRKLLAVLVLVASLVVVLSACPPTAFLEDIKDAVNSAQNAGGTVDDPFFTPSGGTSYNVDQNVVIGDPTPGVTIYYTVDGTTPSASSTEYLGPILVAGPDTTVTIAAIATKSGMKSSHVVTATYTVNYLKLALPTFSPVAGTYSEGIEVAVTAAEGATIYYTTDGTTPTSVYVLPISIAGDGTTKTIKAYASKSGMSDSDVAQAQYTIDSSYNRVATPALSLPGGSYTSAQSVSITCATIGATIRYTLDGPTPSDSVGDLNSGPILISSNKTLQAIACKEGMADSFVATADYSFRAPITPLSFTATGADQAVNLSWNAAGGANSYNVYYAPGASVTKLSGTKIPVSGGSTCSLSVSLLAVNTTYAFIITSVGDYGESDPSSIMTATTFQKAGTPSITPGGQTSITPVSVTITAASGAYISYTTDGSTPSAAGGAPSPVLLTVTKSETIKAIAYKSGMTTSDVAQAAYTIPGSVWVSATIPTHVPAYSVNHVTTALWGFDAISGSGTTRLRSTNGDTWTVDSNTLPGGGWSELVDCGFILLALSPSSWSNMSAHDCYGNDWKTTAMPAVQDWSAAAWDGSGLGGTIVAVAMYSSVCATGTWDNQTNNLAWVARTMPGAATNWVDVTYGAGKFVAIGFDAGISATSSNGATWSGPHSMYDSCNAVTFGKDISNNGIFVAVSSTGYSLTSSDGINWAKHPMPNPGTNWIRVTYGGGVFVAVPYLSPHVATSVDGINWTLRDSPILADYNSSITYKNGTFVEVSGGIAYSR